MSFSLSEEKKKLLTKKQKAQDKAYLQSVKMQDKAYLQSSKGSINKSDRDKALKKIKWYRDDALGKADQAYEKGLVNLKKKQADFVRKEWGRLDPKPTKKKTEKKKNGGVTGSRNFVRRNY